MKVTKDMIDPQLRFTGRMIDLVQGKSMRTVEGARKKSESPGLLDKLIGRMLPKPEGYRTETRWIPRPGGDAMRALIRRPLEPTANVAGILHLHGGGYYMGSPELEFHSVKYIESL